MLSKVKIDSHSIVKLTLTAHYQSQCASHRDALHFEKFNVWRDADLLPVEISAALNDKTAGYKATFEFKQDLLLEPYDTAQCYRIKNRDFNRNPRSNLHIEPRLGRYYPRGWFAGIPNNYSENMFPARIVSIDDDFIEVDFNHPLAATPVSIDIEVHDVYQGTDEHGGRCNDCIADLLSGPGMQLRIPPGQHTQSVDFLADEALKKPEAIDDHAFYQLPRMVNHLDDEALQQLKQFYASRLPRNARMLDLMSSVNSHIPESCKPSRLTGLGMNQQELESNPQLDEWLIHDLNKNPVLPFENSRFDVVMCNLSIEYLENPLPVFEEVNRVLDNHGQLFVTFSNRWFPGMAIQLWTNLHEFERLGLVSEYFLQSGGFENLQTFSLRGLPRPQDDKHPQPLSDPLYVVWATKAS